ncbi:MAG: quinolinate synthase NadA [Synergistaceae bacterium]|nr:quinolinate synthase NadA [Synergistaceae bacterium]
MPDTEEHEIASLKRRRNAVILAHYYVHEEVQALADHIGDSYYLSKMANETDERTIVFCGVKFMGESAKIMNPQKTVLMPDMTADCPMAKMADLDRIDEVRAMYGDVSVVCYMNSTAQTKAKSDVCVTSSNALSIIKKLPNRHIYFVPDENLARYVAGHLPEKHFIFHDGFCHVHTSITKENVERAKAAQPGALVLAHPECKADVLEIADYIGSTSGIIDFATKSDELKFIICTEAGVFYELMKKNPNKNFYTVGHRQYCPSMKSITPGKVKACLENMRPEVVLEESLRVEALRALEAMHEMTE